MEEKEKEALFGELYRLDAEESEEDDTSAVIAFLEDCKTSAPSSIPHLESLQCLSDYVLRPTASLKHAVSAPPIHLSTTTKGRPTGNQSFPPALNVNSRIQQATEDTATLGGGGLKQAILGMPKNGRTRRGRSLEPKPDSQQIFKGLAFFFLPNDDVAPARKLRIRKAMEFGALWVREWRENITHLIVDNNLCYQDILKFLNVSALPRNVTVVNEAYPPNRIRYHFGDFTVSADPQNYRVKGHELVSQHSPTLAGSPSTLLKLKADNASALPLHRTPSRTESNEQRHSELSPSKDDNFAIEPVISISSSEIQPNLKDALEEAIEEAKALQYLPLDLDEDDNPHDEYTIDESEGNFSDDESKIRKKAKRGSFNKSWQQGFACMSKHDGISRSDNPNTRTIEILQKMADYYERHQDHWRFTAYRKAISALKKQANKITTARQASRIPFIGGRLAEKIEEIVWTDKLRRLDNTNVEPIDEVLQSFMKIYGAGLKQATTWIDQGHRTIAELVTKASLTRNQKIGIEHFDDFQARIPRREMDRHDKYVRDTCQMIDASVQFTIGGSYRRGAADSGDVDFIITKPDCSIEVLRTIVLKTLIPQLFDKDYLKAGLATTDEETGSKWHGAAALPGERVWRRIDFLLVPWQEIGAALIYFTGNDIFNRSIRLLASKQGMRLNQRGLWKDVIRGKNRERLTKGNLVEGKDERKIFELLGVPWRPPHHRIC